MARDTPTASLRISATSPVTILQGSRIKWGNRYESWNDACNILPVTSVSLLKAQTKQGKLLHFNKWSSVHFSKNGRENWSYQVWLFSWRRRKRFMIQWLISSRELTVHIISPTYPRHFCWWFSFSRLVGYGLVPRRVFLLHLVLFSLFLLGEPPVRLKPPHQKIGAHVHSIYSCI